MFPAATHWNRLELHAVATGGPKKLANLNFENLEEKVFLLISGSLKAFF